MKTTITIQDGRVTVQVEDNSVKPVALELPVAGTMYRPEEKTSINQSKKTRVKNSQEIKQGSVNSAHEVDKPSLERKCEVCGDDISELHHLSKTCKKPECKRTRTRNIQRKAYYQRKGVPMPSETEKPAYYCKHCLAWTTHESANHPKAEPEFLPGHEKTEEEIEQWKPKPTGFEEPVKHGEPKDDTDLNGFVDTWNCDACRRRDRLCPLHQSMADEGKQPKATIRKEVI